MTDVTGFSTFSTYRSAFAALAQEQEPSRARRWGGVMTAQRPVRLIIQQCLQHIRASGHPAEKQGSHMAEMAEKDRRRTSDALTLTLYSVILLMLAWTYVPA